MTYPSVQQSQRKKTFFSSGRVHQKLPDAGTPGYAEARVRHGEGSLFGRTKFLKYISFP
jgi:hypothetical protein